MLNDWPSLVSGFNADQGTSMIALTVPLMAERLFIMTDLHRPYLDLNTARLLRPPGLKAVSPFAKNRSRHT